MPWWTTLVLLTLGTYLWLSGRANPDDVIGLLEQMLAIALGLVVLFVEAARSLGASPVWILRRYLLRNVITSVPVLVTLNSADAVLVLGGLGFLGLGLPETVPEWGSDLNLALAAVPTGIWWTALYPGLAMFVLVLGLSFLGEGLEAWVSGGEAPRS